MVIKFLYIQTPPTAYIFRALLCKTSRTVENEEAILLLPDALRLENNQRQLFKWPQAFIDLGSDSKHIITIFLLFYNPRLSQIFQTNN